MIDTPRCNALESNPLDSFDYRAWMTLARELERELLSSRPEGGLREELDDETIRANKAERLLRRIADANVIFPSMCANNTEAWNLTEELKQYRSTPQSVPLKAHSKTQYKRLKEQGANVLPPEERDKESK